MKMKRKQKYRRLERADVVAIVRGYHFEGRTQPSLAEEYGIDSGHVCRLVHGDAWPDVYAEVAAEKSAS